MAIPAGPCEEEHPEALGLVAYQGIPIAAYDLGKPYLDKVGRKTVLSSSRAFPLHRQVHIPEGWALERIEAPEHVVQHAASCSAPS